MGRPEGALPSGRREGDGNEGTSKREILETGELWWDLKRALPSSDRGLGRDGATQWGGLGRVAPSAAWGTLSQ